MRPEIDDEFLEDIKTEFKARRGLTVDIDHSAMLKDILTEWKNSVPKKVKHG